VAFTSDHGDFLGDHGRLRKGFAASDCLLHVPLIVRAPGTRLPARVETPVSNCDVLPTLLALAGQEIPAGLDGTDLTRRPEDDDRLAFAFAGNGDPAARNHTVYDRRHRLTWYPGADFVELFDHADDPGECHKRRRPQGKAAVVREIKAQLAARLAASYNPNLARRCAW